MDPNQQRLLVTVAAIRYTLKVHVPQQHQALLTHVTQNLQCVQEVDIPTPVSVRKDITSQAQTLAVKVNLEGTCTAATSGSGDPCNTAFAVCTGSESSYTCKCQGGYYKSVGNTCSK
ncbi:hypothetical protein MAR_033742, partial [Mya arenaria]